MSKKTILIIEDEFLVALDMERILADAGYKVTAIAADRAEALAAACEAEIAFVDVNLRDGPTGPAIACELAKTYGTRVVYVTANPAQIDPRAPTAIGYVRKPFSDSAIIAAASLAADRAREATIAANDVTLFEPFATGTGDSSTSAGY
jgi:CheY-like chemotaxis protein